MPPSAPALQGHRQLRGGVQAVGIQHSVACEPGQKLLHKGASLGSAGIALGGAAKAGAEQQHGGLLPPDERHIFRCNAAFRPRTAGTQAAFRQADGCGADHRFHAGKGHDARAGAQSAFCGQQCRAAIERTARHSQHAAKGALMAVPRAAGDILPDKFGCNFCCHCCTSGRTI